MRVVNQHSVGWPVIAGPAARYAQRFVLVCLAVALLAIASAVLRIPRADDPDVRASTAPVAIQGFRTTAYTHDRLRLRVSGDSVTIANAKIFGPFSLGFAHSLVARNLTVEVFPADETSSIPALGSSLNEMPELVAQQSHNSGIMTVDIAPLTVIERRGGDAKVLLRAASCRAGLLFSEIFCLDGMVERAGHELPFRQLSYDRKSKALHATP